MEGFFLEDSFGEIGTTKICLSKIRAAEIDTIEFDISEIDTAQVCPAQDGLLEPSSYKADPTEIGATKIGSS